MNVFDLAKEMELEGKKIYEQLLDKTSNSGLKKIIQMLLDAEINHFHIFDAMSKEQSPEEVIHVHFEDIKPILASMKDEEFNFTGEEVDLYKKALKFETNTEKFYRSQAEKTDNPKTKEEFLEVAGEELKHKVLIQNLLDFVNRPNEWIENAEFNHLDEY